MDEWFGKLKQSIKGELPGQQVAPVPPSDPKVISRIDLKTAPREDIIEFVKKQHEQLKKFESFISKYEKRHQQYKQQLEAASNANPVILEGDTALKQRIHDITVERDALAAELGFLEQTHKSLQDSVSLHHENTRVNNNTSNSCTLEEKEALESQISKLLKKVSQMESEENKLKNTIEVQNINLKNKDSRVAELMAQIQSLNTATEAFRTKFQTLVTEQIQSKKIQFENEHKMEELMFTIDELKKKLEIAEKKIDLSSNHTETSNHPPGAPLPSETDTIATIDESKDIDSNIDDRIMILETKNAEILESKKELENELQSTLGLNDSLHLQIQELKNEKNTILNREEVLQSQLSELQENIKISTLSVPTTPSEQDHIENTSYSNSSNSTLTEEVRLEAQNTESSQSPSLALSDPLSNPYPNIIKEKEQKITTLEEKLVHNKTLLAKVHKHLGEISAQLSDVKAAHIASQENNSQLKATIKSIQEEQEEKIKQGVEIAVENALKIESAKLTSQMTANLKIKESEYMDKIEHLEEQLRTVAHDFEQYKEFVKSQGNINSEDSNSAESLELPEVVQRKLEMLTAQIIQLEAANKQFVQKNELQALQLGEMAVLKQKYDSLLSQFKQLKESDDGQAKAAVADKYKLEIENLKSGHKKEIMELENRLDTSNQNLSIQLVKLRQKADEIIKQRDLEISNLKDTSEVLKLQVKPENAGATILRHTGASEPSTTPQASQYYSTGLAQRYESSSPTRKRLVSGDTGETLRTHKSASIQPPRSGTHADSNEGALRRSIQDNGRDMEGMTTQEVAKLIQRISSLTESVSELEKLLNLSREQEKFLKSELRRNERLRGPGSSGESVTKEMTRDDSQEILKNVLKNMLESGELPSISLVAELLHLTEQEVQDIKKARNQKSTGVVEGGINALWKVFGSPQQRS